MARKETGLSPTAIGAMATMAARFNMAPAVFQSTLMETIMPRDKEDKPPSRSEVASFLIVANEYELNPFTKEIYAFPSSRGGVVPMVGIDGWVSLVNRRPEMDGIRFEFADDDKGKPFSCTCWIHRKDRSLPAEVTEYYSEAKRNTNPWRDMPRRMLRHKALIQCARIAFGFSGIYDEDEAKDIANADATVIRSEQPPTIASPDGLAGEPLLVVEASADDKLAVTYTADKATGEVIESDNLPPGAEVQAEMIPDDENTFMDMGATRSEADPG